MRTLGLILVMIIALGLMALLALPWALPRPGLDGEIPAQPFSDSGFSEIDGVRLHHRLRAYGQADQALVVLLHGFGGSTFSWRHSLDALEQAGFRAVAIDLPPFGYSQRKASGPDWASLVEGLVDEIDADARLIVVGHSMGAGVAARLAARNPQRIDQLVLVAGTPRMQTRNQGPGLHLINQLPSLGRWAEILAARRLVEEDGITPMLASAFGREPSEEELAGYLHPLTIPGTYPALLQRMAAESSQLSEGWQAVPTLLIWGEEDRWVPLSVAESLLEQYPETPLRLMPGTGHNPMDTEADAFNQLLLESLVR